MKVRTPPGMRDFYPEDQRLQNWLFDHWRSVSQSFGFQEYEGPIFEFLDLYRLKSGEGIVSELFNFTDRGGREFAIRPEMTPTLARMVAARANALPRPIKWFSIPRMCRAERPQRGRLREFFQWNADVLGSDDPLADAEVIAVAAAFFRTVGLDEKTIAIKINHRGIATAALIGLGVPADRIEQAFNMIDRYDRMEPDVFAKMWDEAFGESLKADKLQSFLASATLESCLELAEKGSNEAAASGGTAVSAVSGQGGSGPTANSKNQCGTGVPPVIGQGGKAANSEERPARGPDATLGRPVQGPDATHAAQLRGLWKNLEAMGVGPYCEFDLKIVRGLAYYTGAVFEVHARAAGLRALLGGGRYDNLTGLLDGPAVPGVGFGCGDVPVLECLKELGKLPDLTASLDVFIIDAAEEFFPAVLDLAGALRAAGLSVDFSYKRAAVGKQFKQASARNARYAVVIGDEFKDGRKLTVKDLAGGSQATIGAEELRSHPHVKLNLTPKQPQ